MSPLPTGHVGDLGAALVDDQLDPAMRELVLRHLVRCVMCRHDVEEQRLLKARLGALAAPGLPMSLFTRLSAMDRLAEGAMDRLAEGVDGSAGLESVDDVGSEAASLALMPNPLQTSNAPTAPSPASSWFAPHRGRRLLAGAASFLLVGVGTAYAAAGGGQPGSPSQPAANVLTTRNASDITGSVPLNDPAFTAMTASFGR